jgi:hypothetical protein
MQTNAEAHIHTLVIKAGGGGGPTFILGHFSILKYVIALENCFQITFE